MIFYHFFLFQALPERIDGDAMHVVWRHEEEMEVMVSFYLIYTNMYLLILYMSINALQQIIEQLDRSDDEHQQQQRQAEMRHRQEQRLQALRRARRVQQARQRRQRRWDEHLRNRTLAVARPLVINNINNTFFQVRKMRGKVHILFMSCLLIFFNVFVIF